MTTVHPSLPSCLLEPRPSEKRLAEVDKGQGWTDVGLWWALPKISLQTEPLISPWLAGRDEKGLQMNLLVGMLPVRLTLPGKA